MGVEASLGGSGRALTVEPGESATIDLTLRATGGSPETVRLKVTGAAGPFSFCVPDSVSVEPGRDAVARVGFRIPRMSLPPAGPLPFTILADGSSEPLVEGVVQVSPFSALSAT